MRKTMVIFCLAWGLGFSVQKVQAKPDPYTLADNCIGEVQRVVGQSCDRIYNVKTAAVNNITDFLLAGQTWKAQVTAFQAITRIRMMQRVSVITVTNNCRWCAFFLYRMGWPDLAGEVMSAYEEAVDQIRFDANDAVDEIMYVLAGQTGNDEGGEEIYE